MHVLGLAMQVCSVYKSGDFTWKCRLWIYFFFKWKGSICQLMTCLSIAHSADEEMAWLCFLLGLSIPTFPFPQFCCLAGSCIFEQEIYSLTPLEARKSKIKVLAGFGYWWELSSWLANNCLLLCLLSLFYKDISPTGLGPNPYNRS